MFWASKWFRISIYRFYFFSAQLLENFPDALRRSGRSRREPERFQAATHGSDSDDNGDSDHHSPGKQHSARSKTRKRRKE